ncbi:hypothetical protein Cgig2_009015 [Carnegiea gigantea]|uniref:Reverse transcriptase domain-containing protein n=1 Tax=Carnegiea gigantea TaxID=171969 RepID=A0A9Q1KE12_9CARY|nr:hypothetical protein Cgig2_009015 [Carnegiea gigantea]
MRAIARQVSEQVRRAMEVANSARPPPHFDYLPVHEGEPPHRSERISSPRYTERGREVSQLDRSGQPYTEQLGRRAATGPTGRPTQGVVAKSATAFTPYATHSRKYCEFHEQSGHTTTECRELKKALHELADKGQIDRFLKKGPRSSLNPSRAMMSARRRS